MEPNRKSVIEKMARDVAHTEWPRLTPGQLNTFAQYAVSHLEASAGLPWDGELQTLFRGLAIKSPWMTREVPEATRVKSYLLATNPNLKPDERMRLSRDVDQMDPDQRLAALPASNDKDVDPGAREQARAVGHAFNPAAPATLTDDDLLARVRSAVGETQWGMMGGNKRAEALKYMRANCCAPPLPQTPIAQEMIAKGISDPNLLHPRDRLALAREQQATARAAAANK